MDIDRLRCGLWITNVFLMEYELIIDGLLWLAEYAWIMG